MQIDEIDIQLNLIAFITFSGNISRLTKKQLINVCVHNSLDTDYTGNYLRTKNIII